jgi:hypothetical protein
MNPALTAERKLAAVSLDKLLALLGLPSKRSTAQLSGATVEIFKSITKVLDDLLKTAIDARTAESFVMARQQVFGDYARSVRALADLARVIIPKPVIQRLMWESFSEIEAELREHGADHFGTPIKDQAMFTVWSLRKTSDLILKIAGSGPVAEQLKQQDAKLAGEFSFCTVWTQFHLDCLLAAIRFDKSIQVEILGDIQDGLRAAVNAYGLARQGLDLRVPPTEPQLARPVWDEEDEELLHLSMQDIADEVETL